MTASTSERLLQADRLLIVGFAEQASSIYREVVAADPDDARAIIGLANCEVELGHDRTAYDLAVRALRLDHANDIAQRLEARLAEVLAARGEGVQRPGWVTR